MNVVSQLDTDEIINTTLEWLKTCVIGLNLCPFANKPFTDNTIRVTTCLKLDEDEILSTLKLELERLGTTKPAEIETTLLVIPFHFDDFYDFNDFLYKANEFLVLNDWEGVIQLASFHPEYQFAETSVNDKGNFTNRSPYPIVHLIREESLSNALDFYPDVDKIPDRNISTMNALSEHQIKDYFFWLNGNKKCR